VLDSVLAVAAETGATPSQVSMAWLRGRATPSDTHLPIIGPRSVAQLEDYLGALEVELTAEQLARLDAVSAVPAGVPHGVGDAVHDAVLGGVADRFLPRALPVV
jgi:aryl-alcohol dehydrogenase-like predicted oxidoreductase